MSRWDALVVVALTAAAAVLRRGVLPTDGLWFDDSWVAAGAVLGRPSELLTVGTAHPSFTALLMFIDRVGGGTRQMAVPALVASTLAPAALYLVARWTGNGRPSSLVTASFLVVAAYPLMYAGRVKGYVIDVVLVLVVAVVVAWASGRRWRPLGAVAWVLGAWVVGGMSGTMLMVTGVAGALLVLQAHGDRWLRAVAVGVQGLGQLWYLRELDQRLNLESLDDTIERLYDPQVDLSLNPFTTAEEVLEHLKRIGELYPRGIEGVWLALLVAVSIGGLVLGAVRARRREGRLVARFLLLVVAAAFVGGLLGVLPFGARNPAPGPMMAGLHHSPGGRYNLWLVGPVGVGLTFVLDALLGLARGARAQRAVTLVAVVTACFVVGRDGFPAGPPAPFPGSASAAHDLDGAIGPEDRAVILGAGTYAYPIDSAFPSEVVATPQLEVGFSPVVQDPRFLTVGAWAPEPDTFERLPGHIDGAERVFIYSSGAVVGAYDLVTGILTDAGYVQVELRRHDWAFVDVWEPGPGR